METGPLATELNKLVLETEQAFERLVAFNYQLGEALRLDANAIPEPELVDMGYLFAKLRRRFDEMRLESQAREQLLGMIIAKRVITKIVEDPTCDQKSIGSLASAVPDVKTVPILPKKTDPKYLEILKNLGVRGEALESQLVKIDWRQYSEFLTTLEAAGKPAPFKVDTGKEFKCLFYPRKRHGK